MRLRGRVLVWGTRPRSSLQQEAAMTIDTNGEQSEYPPCVVCKKPVDFRILHVTWQIRTGFETRRETFQVNKAEVVAVIHLHCADPANVWLRELIEGLWMTQ